MHITGTIKLTYGCHAKISDAEVYTAAWPEGFTQDKGGEFWPDRDYEAPALVYNVEIDVQYRHPVVSTGIARYTTPYGGETLLLPVENYNQDDIWHVVG